jgi:hypothetical protein
MAFVSRDLMVNVLYKMTEGEGEGEGDRTGCTPSPTHDGDDGDDGGGCTPSPPDRDCTPSPPANCTPSPPDHGCTPSPVTGYGDEDESPRQALASLRQQLRETLAQA